MVRNSKKNRLAFFTPKMCPASGERLGVQKKVQGQLRAFATLGFEVGSFAFPPYSSSGNPIKDLVYSYAYNRTQYKDCLDHLVDFHPDAVYIRYGFSDSHFLHFLEQFRKEVGPTVPILLEIATYPYDRELCSSVRPGLLYLYLADLGYRGKLRNFVNHLVTFSAFDRIFNIPTIKISNGVDTRSIQPTAATVAQVDDNVLHLIGMSNLAYWTGYERMIRGLAKYKKQAHGTKLIFHIVGDGQNRESMQALAEELGITKDVIFHGAHSGVELDRLFQGCQLAVGNLAVHRKGMTINPDLKNREYCARGFPIVTSTIDPGFPQDFPYLLIVPPDESPIDIATLVKFWKTIQQDHPQYGDEIRDFSVKHFDWSVMLKPVAEKIRELLG